MNEILRDLKWYSTINEIIVIIILAVWLFGLIFLFKNWNRYKQNEALLLLFILAVAPIMFPLAFYLTKKQELK